MHTRPCRPSPNPQSPTLFGSGIFAAERRLALHFHFSNLLKISFLEDREDSSYVSEDLSKPESCLTCHIRPVRHTQRYNAVCAGMLF